MASSGRVITVYVTTHITYRNSLYNIVHFRRFPVISGFRVSWDSRRPPGQRVLGVWLLNEVADSEFGHETASGHTTPRLIDGGEINREEGGRKYKIVTREYMAEGHDGFLPLKGKTYLIDDETGQLMSTLVRRYLLGESTVIVIVQYLIS